jgi:hypothetical protein
LTIDETRLLVNQFANNNSTNYKAFGTFRDALAALTDKVNKESSVRDVIGVLLSAG